MNLEGKVIFRKEGVAYCWTTPGDGMSCPATNIFVYRMLRWAKSLTKQDKEMGLHLRLSDNNVYSLSQ